MLVLALQNPVFFKEVGVVKTELVYTFNGTLIWGMIEGILIVFLGKRIGCLIEYHGLVVLLFKELEEINFLIELSESLLQVLVLRFELPHILTVQILLSRVIDLRV